MRQHVGLHGLAAQREALFDAEPVLLVHDRKRQAGELDPLLYQRVRADRNAVAAGRNAAERAALLRPREPAMEPRHADA
jgi:hypothetical protein